MLNHSKLNLIAILILGLFLIFLIKYDQKNSLENEFILTNNLSNHFEQFAPIDVIRLSDEYKNTNLQNILPFSGISNSSAVQSCGEYFEIVKLDQYGFRNNNNDWGENLTIAFGDSLTYGSCASENFIDILKIKFNKKILNLSQPGNTFPINVVLLKEVLKKYKIKNAIFFIYEESFYYNFITDQNDILKKYLLSEEYNQNFFYNKEFFDRILIKDLFVQETNHLLSIKNNLNKVYKKAKSLIGMYDYKKSERKLLENKLEDININKNITIFFEYLNLLQKLSDQFNFSYSLILLPNKKNIEQNTKIYNALKSKNKSSNSEIFEIKKFLKKHKKTDELYLFDSSHYSNLGHLEIAKILNKNIN